MIYLVAELAGELGPALLPDEGVQLLTPHTDEGAGDPLPAAVAAVLHRLLREYLQLKFRKHLLHQLPGAQAAPQRLGYRAYPGDTLLDGGDGGVICAGEELNEVSTGALHALVHVHQHAQGTGGGDLSLSAK